MFYASRMDIDALHSALLSIVVLSKKVRSARERLFVKSDGRSALVEFLQDVERDLQVTKATLAGELGFALCPRCWPPELAATDPKGRINCPSCGKSFR
jgi:hypothetical protein